MDSRDEHIASSSEPTEPGPTPSLRPLPSEQDTKSRGSAPLLAIAFALLAGALALFGALALVEGARNANLRLTESEAGLSAGVTYAAQAIETRLDLVIRRARERGPGTAAPNASPTSLRRLEATPDPLINSVRTVPPIKSRGITIGTTQDADGEAVTVLSFPALEGEPSGVWMSVRLSPNWLSSALGGGAPTDRLVMVIAAPDGHIAGSLGDKTRAALLVQNGRLPLDLLGALRAPEDINNRSANANPLDLTGAARVWKPDHGNELLVASAQVAPGFTLIAASPATPAAYAWNGRLLGYALLGGVPLVLGLGLIAVLFHQRRRVRETERRLHASDALLNLTVTSTGCGLWDWDIEGGRIYWSGPLLALVGRPARGTWLTLTESFQLIAPPDVGKIERIRGDLESGAGKVETVLRLQHLRGHTIWCQARLRLWEAEMPRLVGLFIDISESVEARHNAEQTSKRILQAVESGSPEAVALLLDPEGSRRLAAATEELERSRMELTDLSQKYAAERTRAAEIGRAKNEFLANMSHELKTPLNAIIGFSEIMQNELYGSIGDDRYRGYAADIYDSGRQLAGLIDDILEMSKIESGRIELNAEDLDLGGLAAECVRLIEPRARDCGVALDNLIIEAPLASGDRRATKRILMNLLSNAVKFTPRGGRIEMTAAEGDKFVTVSVEDNGIGIAEDDLERILAPFEQVEQHHSRSHRGAGLGLAISKALSEMQGGSLKIESTQGVGTRVSLELPHTHALFSGGSGSSELQHVS